MLWIAIPILLLLCVLTINNTFIIVFYVIIVIFIAFIIICSIKITPSFQYANLPEINRNLEDVSDDSEDDETDDDDSKNMMINDFEEDNKRWNLKKTAEWIQNIDKQRLNKYNKLIDNMTKEGIDGSCLQYLDKNDLHRLGITKFKDKLIVLKAIKQLLTKESDQYLQ